MGKLGLTVAYIVPLTLIAWVWIAGGAGKRTRLVILALLPLIYLGYWKAVERYEGWPADAVLPAQFELISADIIEPDSQQKIEGRIHLWLKNEPHDAPRSFVLAYSRELHEMVQLSLNRLKQGARQSGTTHGREHSGKGVSLGSAMELTIEDRSVRVLPPKSI